MKCKTVFKKDVINSDIAAGLYNFLKWNIEWEDGVKSKFGFTRKAKPLNYGDIKEIDDVIDIALQSLTDTEYVIQGIYLNYYENGNMWTPNHTHKGTHQLVISLGCTRTLQINKKNFSMSNGDAIIFGSSAHGVPKDDSVDGRISIATFMVKKSEFFGNHHKTETLLFYDDVRKAQLKPINVMDNEFLIQFGGFTI